MTFQRKIKEENKSWKKLRLEAMDKAIKLTEELLEWQKEEKRRFKQGKPERWINERKQDQNNK